MPETPTTHFNLSHMLSHLNHSTILKEWDSQLQVDISQYPDLTTDANCMIFVTCDINTMQLVLLSFLSSAIQTWQQCKFLRWGEPLLLFIIVYWCFKWQWIFEKYPTLIKVYVFMKIAAMQNILVYWWWWQWLMNHCNLKPEICMLTCY